MKKTFIGIAAGLVALSMSSEAVQAQTTHWCQSDQHMHSYLQKHGLEEEFELYYDNVLQEARAYGEQNRGNRAVRTIPVVVHVLWSNPSENTSDFTIQGMINTMNEDFRRMNPDANQTRPAFTNDAADVEIEFCLATVDPQGNATDGITRKQVTKTEWDFDTELDDMKDPATQGVSAWDPDSYLNVWVVDIAPGQNGNVLGYAYLPFGQVVGTGLDGFVIDYQSVGYGLRTATHEIGHYLGLRHPWGSNGGCGDDDGLADTPNTSGPNFGCNTNSSNCGSLDMIENFMDYSSCDNMFSQDQSDLMNSILSGVRSSLLNSNGCGIADYVIPTSNTGTDEGDFIDGVELESISNLNTGATGGPSYNDYTTQKTDLAQEGTYTMTITSGDWPAGFPDYYAAWVDWNQDLDFDDAGEKLGEFLSSAALTGEDITFTVPANAFWGDTRMRVRGIWNDDPGLDPDENYEYGETEDYTVTVIQPQPPVAAISVSDDTILLGQSVDFLDMSTNFPDVWSWNFIGADSMSSQQNVMGFVYPETGCFDVYFQVGNSGGGDALYVTCAVYVKGFNENGFPLGISSKPLEEQITVFPNPVRDQLTIELESGLTTNTRLLLVDAVGRTVQTAAVNGVRTTMEFGDVPAGLYFLRIETPLGTSVHRIQHIR